MWNNNEQVKEWYLFETKISLHLFYFRQSRVTIAGFCFVFYGIIVPH